MEVTTSFQHFKYGIEIRIKSVNQDDSHSWVRISHGTVKYANDSIEDTENLADSQEEESVQTSSSVVAARSKAKAKPQLRESTGMTTIPLRERKWIDIEPSKQDLESYRSLEESHQSSSTQSEVTSRRRWSNSILQNKIPSPRPSFSNTDIGPMIDGKLVWAAGGGSKRRYQYCSDNLGSIIYLPCSFKDILEVISLILPLQDNVLIGPGIFPYIYHVGSNFNLHSIVRNGLVPGGQNLSRRQTVFYFTLLIQEMKITKIQRILTSLHHVPRDTCKMHGRDIKMLYFGSILILESRKD